MPDESGSGAVRVFISSTFRDMKAERDHLMRVVFPELEQRCMARGLPFIAVDLRWGVTQEEAESGAALEICLEEIERCRPYFVCLLGERYGWVPLPRVVGEELAQRLVGVAGSLFAQAYVGNEGYKEYLLRSDAARQDLWGEHAEANEHFLLHALEALCVPNAGASITAQEIYHGVLAHPEERMHSLFYFRERSFTEALTGETPDDFHEATDEGRDKLERLKTDIRAAGLKPAQYASLDALGDLVLDQLWARIVEEHPDEGPSPLDPLAEERQAQELFVQRLTSFFVGRRDELAALDGLLAQSPTGYVAVTGPSGCGKTALLANWLYGREGLVSRHAEPLILSHFIGASGRSANAREILTRFCQELAPVAEWTDPLPGDFAELSTAFRQILEAAAQRRPILLVLDALDQLEPGDNARSLGWLPGTLPDNVLLVASSLSGDEYGTWQPLQARAGERMLRVPLLQKPAAEQMIVQYLDQFRKHLSPEQLSVLAGKEEIGSPLYLQVALNELLSFGEYERVTAYLRELPGTIPEMYGFVLEHLEREHGQAFVERVMSYLACGRYGMTEQELLSLAESAGGEVAPLKWARMHRILSPHLLRRGEVLAFYHRQLQAAVERRYLQGARVATHADIARYFESQPLTNRRKLDEQPYQQLAGELWDALVGTLTDLLFLEAKCEAGMTYDLVGDYNPALAHPGLSPANRAAIDPYARFVRANAHLFAQDLEWLLQRACNSASSGPVVDAAERLLAGSTRPWLRLINRPADGPSACLAVLEGHTDVLTGLAVAADGSRAVTTSDDRTARVWDLATGRCLRVLEAHTDALCAVALTGKDEQALTAAGDRTLRLWDLASGQCLRVFTGHTAPVMAVAATRDGVRAVSGGAEGAVRVWDLSTGECLRIMTGHDGAIFAVALTPDGCRAFTGGYDGVARVWDLASGQCLQTLLGHKGTIEGIAVTSAGNRLVTAGGWRHPVKGATPAGETIGVWDLATGECVSMLEPPAGQVTSAAVTQDGTRALTGHGDRALRIWDLATGDCVGILEGHARGVVCVAVAADDTRAVTIAGYDDHTIRIWDLTAALSDSASEMQDTSVISVALALDGSLAVTGAVVGTIRLWEMATGACLRTLEGQKAGNVGFLAVTPNAARAVSATMGDSARLWDLAGGECLRSLDAYVWGIESAAMTPDGGRLVAGGYDGSIRAWDLTTGDSSIVAKWEGSPAKALALSPDGGLALTMGTFDKAVAVWSLTSGERLRTLEGHTDSLMALVVTPDARRAVTSAADGTLRIWDLSTGRCLRVLEGFGRGEDNISVLAATADGERVVSACSNGRVAVWDLATGERREAFIESTGHICLFALTPDGRHVVFCGWDKAIRVWDLDSGREIARLRAAAVADPCATGPLGALAAGDRAGNVYLMRLENVESGPDVLTAWRSPVDGATACGCPGCRLWSEVPPSALGTEIPCPHCGEPVKLNPFTIDADWRPIASAWHGED